MGDLSGAGGDIPMGAAQTGKSPNKTGIQGRDRLISRAGARGSKIPPPHREK